MLPAQNEISTQQSKPITHTIIKWNRLLGYASINLDAIIQYHKIEMILHGDTNDAYLLLPKSCSTIAGHFYLSDRPPTTGTPKPKRNGPILTVCQTLKNVLASSAQIQSRYGSSK